MNILTTEKSCTKLGYYLQSIMVFMLLSSGSAKLFGQDETSKRELALQILIQL